MDHIAMQTRYRNSHKGARSGHRTVESVTRDPALSIIFVSSPTSCVFTNLTWP